MSRSIIHTLSCKIAVKTVFMLLLLSAVTVGNSQQLDKIGKKGGISLSGGLGFDNSMYFSDEATNRNTPYMYSLSGNANLNLYGWSIPFTVRYSNQKFTTGQPFNIVGMSPTYKNVTFHIGTRSMSFSPYTLAGHTFTGGGVECSFSKIKLNVKAMGGRLLKAVDADTALQIPIATYARYGGGLMLGYTLKSTELSLIGFHARDYGKSLSEYAREFAPEPQLNTVYSVGLKRSISGVVSVYAEGAFSAWTRNANDSLLTNDNEFYKSLFFIPVTTGTYYYGAYKAGVSFSGKLFTLGVDYQRVDPYFQTLGAYMITNDFENIALNASTSFFKKKLSLQGSLGLQRDDLKDDKLSKMNRVVGSASISYVPNEKLSFQLSYSGFNSNIRIKPIEQEYLENTQYDHLDTMNYIQITTSYNGSFSWKILENDNVTHSVSENASFQKADSEQGNTRFGNDIFNNVTSYSLFLKKSGLSSSVSANVNTGSYDSTLTSYWGVGLNSGLPVFKKKLSISLGANISLNYEDKARTATLYSVSNSYSFSFGKGHSINAALRYSGRQKLADAQFSAYNTSVNEFSVGFSYKYSFTVKSKKNN